MPSLNIVILMGNLTRDPELRYTPGGTAVCDLGLAVNRKVKGKDGEWREEADFLSITTGRDPRSEPVSPCAGTACTGAHRF